MDSEELINKHCDYIISEYLKAGGDIKDVDRNFTYWTLCGIFDREGVEALETFVRNWKPHIAKPRVIGYAGI